jgi:hypothetical protein
MNENYITKAYGSLVGKTIKEIRALKDTELSLFGWEFYKGEGMVIIFDDHSALIPSADAEGNGPGHLFVEKVS